MPKEATELTASEAARAIASGSLSAREYVSDLLRRYTRDLKYTGALTHFDADAAAAAVRGDDPYAGPKPANPVERVLVQEGHKGPLAGVPFVVSANIDVARAITSAGTPTLEFNKPREDATVVAALTNAGGAVLSHAHVNELNLGATGANPLYGTVKNPYSQTSTAGGACGGAAAAVAGRVVPIALGVDTVGDVRVPASLCGVVGFRPTHGRYPREGVLSLSSTLDHVGVMARTVEDIQLVDAVLCAHDTNPEDSKPADASAGLSDAATKIQAHARGFLARRQQRSTSRQRVAPSATAAAPLGGDVAAGKDESTAATKIQAIVRGRRDRKYTARLQENRETAQGRLATLRAPVSGPSTAHAGAHRAAGSASDGAGGSTADAAARQTLVGNLAGVRIGVPRKGYFDDLHASTAAIVEAALDRLREAGAELVEVELGNEAGSAPSSTVLALGTAQPLAPAISARGSTSSHPMDMAGEVIDAILGFESVRELAAYLVTHASPPPPPPKKESGEDEEPEEEEDPAAAARARCAAAAPKPLDTLVSVTTIVSGYQGAATDKLLLDAQRDPRLAVSSNAYRSALVHARPALKRAFMEIFRKFKVAAIVYPTTPAPAAALKGADNTSVEHNGSLVDATALYTRNTRAASAAGLPCLSIPCGATKPRTSVAPGAAADRLPVSLEFVAPSGEDEHLLALGRAFQKLQPLLPDPIVVARWGEGVTRSMVV